MSAGDDIRYGRRGGGWLPRPKVERCAKCQGPITPARKCAWCGRVQLSVITGGDEPARPVECSGQLSLLDDGGAA